MCTHAAAHKNNSSVMMENAHRKKETGKKKSIETCWFDLIISKCSLKDDKKRKYNLKILLDKCNI